MYKNVKCMHFLFFNKFFSFLVCFQTGPFNLASPPLTTYNQQLWLTCVMQAENSNSKNTE